MAKRYQQKNTIHILSFEKKAEARKGSPEFLDLRPEFRMSLILKKMIPWYLKSGNSPTPLFTRARTYTNLRRAKSSNIIFSISFFHTTTILDIRIL